MLELDNKLIRFEEATHSYYRVEDGLRVPGISELLKYFGYIDDRYYSDIPRDRGIIVHDTIADLCNGGQAALGHDDPEIVGRIEAFVAFQQAKDFRAQHIEQIFFNPLINLACRVDLMGTFGDAPIPVIIEIKCGSKAMWHELQTAAQALCYGPVPIRRFVLYLKSDGKFDLREFTDRSTVPLVQSMIALYWWNKAHGITLVQGRP